MMQHAREIHLTVRDKGVGFDVESVTPGKGLGLISMRERVRLLRGTFTLKSKPMGGTTIDVHVPLSQDAAA
jgi:signal transduction histidine kinase